MADSIVKFFDANIRPPRGGWHVMIAGRRVEKYSESDALAELRVWRQNNLTFTSEDDLQRELWAYYCSQEPERCGQLATPLRSSTLAARNLIPEVAGPWIWQHLNLVGARWAPTMHDWFLGYLDMIAVLIECPVCQQEWRMLIAERPPMGLTTRREVCQWICDTHNSVNRKLGKPNYDYSRGVIEYGFPPR